MCSGRSFLCDVTVCRVSVVSPGVGSDGFLRVLQLLHAAHQPQRGDRGDGQHDISAPR